MKKQKNQGTQKFVLTDDPILGSRYELENDDHYQVVVPFLQKTHNKDGTRKNLITKRNKQVVAHHTKRR